MHGTPPPHANPLATPLRQAQPLADLTFEPAEDALILTIGCSGSGKSTLAAAWFEPHEIFSSDQFRLLLTNDAGDQDCNQLVFPLLRRFVSYRLQRGLLTVLDATNLGAAQRRPWRKLAAQLGRPCYALVLMTPPALCRARNRRRQRRVPAAVLREQTQQWRRDLRRLPHEGFDRVIFLDGTREPQQRARPKRSGRAAPAPDPTPTQ